MPLPVTITGLSTTIGPAGPFKSSGENFYFLGVDSTNNYALDVYKATDPTDSWSQASTVSTTSNLAISEISAVQVSDNLHVALAITNGATNTDYRYYVYSMSSDSFTTSNEAIETNISAIRSVAITVRSTGDVIVLYNGTNESIMGTAYRRVNYARRVSGVWTTAIAVDAGGSLDYNADEAILGASDRVHFFYALSSSPQSIYQRTLNSSNVLQTVSSAVSGAGGGIVSAVSYNRDGTQKIVAVSPYSFGSDAVWFDSGDTPTISSTALSAATAPMLVFNDGTDVWAVYRATDGDLYARLSQDDGATWDTQRSIFVGTVGNSQANISRNGNVYLRGNSYVIPYVVDDNGTIKYNEYAIPKSSLVFSPYRLLPYLVR